MQIQTLPDNNASKFNEFINSPRWRLLVIIDFLNAVTQRGRLSPILACVGNQE